MLYPAVRSAALQRAATEFFTTAARNLQQTGERSGVARYVVVSIIGIEKSTGGYGSAKLAHEQAVLAGPVPARILRVAKPGSPRCATSPWTAPATAATKSNAA
jgi:hypothetical protein